MKSQNQATVNKGIKSTEKDKVVDIDKYGGYGKSRGYGNEIDLLDSDSSVTVNKGIDSRENDLVYSQEPARSYRRPGGYGQGERRSYGSYEPERPKYQAKEQRLYETRPIKVERPKAYKYATYGQSRPEYNDDTIHIENLNDNQSESEETIKSGNALANSDVNINRIVDIIMSDKRFKSVIAPYVPSY